MELEYQYRITYENGQTYDRTYQLRTSVSKEEYKTVMMGVIKGVPIRGITGIEE